MSVEKQIRKALKTDLTQYSCIPFWGWNDELEPDKLIAQMDDMKNCGIKNLLVHARNGLITEYLGEEWFQYFGKCLQHAKKTGQKLWIYDEKSWPSGFGGGLALTNSENYVQYITHSIENCFIKQALAVYIIENNTARRVLADEGQKEYFTVMLHKNASYIDVLNPDATDAFIHCTYELYYNRFADEFGKTIIGAFTDEPQLYRFETAFSTVLIEEFSKEYGYNLLSNLPALFIECEGYEKYRYDYWLLVNKLYIQNYIKRIFDWCDRHHLKLTGHSVQENNFFEVMWGCAGIMPFYEYEHIPGIDWLGTWTEEETVAKQCTSVAAQLGKKQILVEIFAASGWEAGPKKLKHLVEWLFVSGVNLLCQSIYTYTIRGLRKRDYPIFLSGQLPWYAENKKFNDYFSKLGFLLASSKEDVQTLILHPIRSCYMDYIKQNEHCLDKQFREFEKVIQKYSKAHIPYHLGDETIMAKYAHVEGDMLIIGECKYSSVVLPDMKTLSANTADLIKDFIANGGKVILEGEKPCMQDAVKAEFPWLIPNTSFGEMMIQKQVQIEYCGECDIRCTLRSGEPGSFLYVVNLSDSTAENVRIKVNGAKGYKVFDLGDEEIKSTGKDGLTISFDAYQSFFILLDEAAEPAGKVEIIKTIKLEPAFSIHSAENTYTLDNAAFSYDGRTYGESYPVMGIMHELIKKRYNGDLYLKYSFHAKFRPQNISVVIERSKDIRIFVNGKTISLSENNYFNDHSFSKIDIASLIKKGDNEIVLKLHYTQNNKTLDLLENPAVLEGFKNCIYLETELESIYLAGSFGVYNNEDYKKAGEKHIKAADSFYIAEQRNAVSAQDLIQEGFPFFAGKMMLYTEFQAKNGKWRLKLEYNCAAVNVYVNNQFVKSLLWENECELSDFLMDGQNTLGLELVTGNKNIFGPHHLAEPELLYVSPMSFHLDCDWKDLKNPCWQNDYCLEKFGIDQVILENYNE